MNVEAIDQHIQSIQRSLKECSQPSNGSGERLPAAAAEELCAALEDLRRQSQDLFARQAAELAEVKQREATLRRREQELTDFVENAAMGLRWVGPDGTILWANSAELELLGYSQDEYVGHHLAEFHADKNVVVDILAKLTAGMTLPDYEARLLCKDGSIKHVLISSNVCWEDGKFIHSRCFTRDVTDRKQAEAALRASEERFRALIENNFDGIELIGADGRSLYSSPSITRILGYSDTELRGSGIRLDRVHRDDVARVIAFMAELVRHPRQAITTQYRFRHKDGAWRWIEAIANDLLDEPETNAIVVNSRDITEHKQSEEALRAAQERLRHVIASSPAITYVLKVEGNTFLPTWVSENITRMLGYEVLEALAPDWWIDHVHPDDRARVLSEQSLPFPNDRLLREYQMRHKDGTYRWIRDETRLLRDADGQPIEAIGSWSDITEHKRMREALQMSGKRFRALIENSSDGIVLVDANGDSLYISPSASRILGYSYEELVHTGIRLDLVHPDDVQRTRAALAELVQDPGRIVTAQYRFRHKDGSWRWLEATSCNQLDEPSVRAILTNFRDITERKRAEAALRESEERYRRLVEVSPDAIVLTDLNANILMLNSRTLALFGYENAQELIGKNGLDFIIPEDRPRAMQNLQRTLKSGNVHDIEYTVFKKDGTRFAIELSAALILNSQGEPHAFTAVLRDITTRKRAEEEIRQHTARMEVLANISQTFAEISLDYQGVLRTAARHTAELIGDACVIALFSDDGQRAFPVAFHHPDPKALALMHDALLHAWQGGTDTQRFRTLLSGESIYIPVVIPEEYRASSEPEFWPYIDNIGISSVLIVPLRKQDHVIGTLGLTRDQPGHPYTPDDQALLQNLADRAALTIQNAQLFEQAQSTRERLQALSRRLLEVQEVERRHIARELHDEIGQALTGLKLLIDMCAHLPTKAATPRLADAQSLIDDLMDRIHRLSLDLRPTMLDDLGLLPTLLSHTERYTDQTGVSVRFEHTGLERRFPQAIETAAYRIVQEALTNVARHAGVRQVNVRVWAGPDVLCAQIEDLGAGFDARAVLAGHASSGLAGMRERAKLLGGELTIDSTPGAGTRLVAELPLPNQG